MPINAYTGLMGSGQTYEVVTNVILPAVLQGRRIVTNIEGINIDQIHAHLEKTNKQGKHSEDFGGLCHVTNEQIHSDRFFYYGKTEEDTDTIVQPGDLVLVDEAWRFWGLGDKIRRTHMIFFREHRHFVDERGFTCDLVVIVQDISDLHRSLKNVIELTFRTTKLKSLGLNKSYRVDMYESYKVRAKPMSQEVKRYNKDFFKFYSSYTGGPGKERAIDSRQNILGQKKLWFIGGGAVLILVFSVSSVWRYFNRAKPDDKPAPEVVQADNAAGFPTRHDQTKPESEEKAQTDLKGYWHASGPNSRSVSLIQTPDGYRLDDANPVLRRGLMAEVMIDGQKRRFGVLASRSNSMLPGASQ